MKRRIQVALVGALLSMVGHLYLTVHYYLLKFGLSTGQAICNLNAKFDCDAVAASSFSALLGVPLSVWGLVFNGILFVLILLSWLEWTEMPERLRRWTLVFCGISLAASVLMGAVSVTLMQNYCLFCIGLYVLSAVIFFAYIGVLREPFALHFRSDIKVLWTESKGIIAAFIAVPLLAYLTHLVFMQNYGNSQKGTPKFNQQIKESVEDWQVSQKFDFVAKPSMTMGPAPESAAMTVVEFADFRCIYCKLAGHTLHTFIKAHPDVRLEFYSFPRDRACNDGSDSVNNMSCRLAYAVVCAERDGKGWEMHDAIFARQDDINKMSTPSELDVEFTRTVEALNLNRDSFLRCLDEPEVQDAVRAQAKQGTLVNVEATPTVFVNGKHLRKGQLMPVLQAIHGQIKQE